MYGEGDELGTMWVEKVSEFKVLKSKLLQARICKIAFYFLGGEGCCFFQCFFTIISLTGPPTAPDHNVAPRLDDGGT